MDSTIRSEALKPYADATLDKTLQLLEQAFSADDTLGVPPAVRQRLGSGAPRDLDELRPHLKVQADDLIARATGDLLARGEKEGSRAQAVVRSDAHRVLRRVAGQTDRQLASTGAFVVAPCTPKLDSSDGHP